jgi:hypothetical protein
MTQVLFQTEKLKIADELPDVKTLIEELINFKVKISTSGHDSYEAWREGQHDDMVLSLAIGCWFGEKIGLRKKITRKYSNMASHDWLAGY